MKMETTLDAKLALGSAIGELKMARYLLSCNEAEGLSFNEDFVLLWGMANNIINRLEPHRIPD